MEVISPTWHPKESMFYFRLTIASDDNVFVMKGPSVYCREGMESSKIDLPVMPDELQDAIVATFIQQTKQWFTTPIGSESMKKRLRHLVGSFARFPLAEGWFEPVWRPAAIKVFRTGYELVWNLVEWIASSPKITADFLMGSQTPRAQSPEQPAPSAQELRTIQIQDGLIPIGDLPLSDLPPLSVPSDSDSDIKRQEIRQKIREARLRVALAKLKAERMEHKYYERYGEVPDDSEESSELSSESDSGDEPLGRQTYS